MDRPELFRVALGLGTDWNIDKFDFVKADKELHLHLRYVMGSPLPACRECGSAGYLIGLKLKESFHHR